MLLRYALCAPLFLLIASWYSSAQENKPATKQPATITSKMDSTDRKKANNTKITILGDSITAGYGVETEQAFPAIVESILQERGRNVSVISSGFSGSTSANGMGRLKWIMKAKPDIVVIELGANDGLRGQPISNIKKNLRQMIRYAKEKKIKIILVGIKLPANYGEEYRTKFAALYPKLAKEEKVKFFPFIEQFHKQKDLTLPDGLHPNVKGHKLIAKEIANFLEEFL